MNIVASDIFIFTIVLSAPGKSRWNFLGICASFFKGICDDDVKYVGLAPIVVKNARQKEPAYKEAAVAARQ